MKDKNNKITIQKSITADTRSADKIVSKKELLKSSEQHIEDVRKAIKYIIERLEEIALLHDYTKVFDIDGFYADFNKTQLEPKTDFKKLDWYQKHITEERHHINDNCPDDITLFDILEMIADVTMAGLARTGDVFPLEVDEKILKKAVKNTVDEIVANTEVK